MAEFLTTNGTSYRIETIIIEAKRKLVLVSPYLQLSKTFFERLKDAANRNVKINIIYGKDELKPNEKNSLAELKNLELFYFENLHAKCYFNENDMVITSMNMYEFSEKNNREMGVHITKKMDYDLFEKATNETLSIIQSSEIIHLTRTKREFYKDKNNSEANKGNRKNNSEANKGNNKKNKRGYCIRCEERIPFDNERPYCFECYSIWSVYENDDYEENVCHSCGEFESTTRLKPLCWDCFRESNSL
jgi:phosphatidylserine/phosphatidylglycerophosphate/cardiolipin synthase-like enzyme